MPKPNIMKAKLLLHRLPARERFLICKIALIVVVVSFSSCQDSTINISSIKELILQDKVVSDEPQKVPGYFIIADGTYSGQVIYSVPKLNTDILFRIIQDCRSHGSGWIWVSYLDNKSSDNEILVYEVNKALMTSPKPGKKEGGYINHKQVLEVWKKKHELEFADSIAEHKKFNADSKEFLNQVEKLLSSKVYVRSERNRQSDVVKSVNSATQVLTNALFLGNITDATIIGFSDFENDPNNDEVIPLNPQIKVYNLISQPGASKNAIKSSVELESIQSIYKVLKK
jgi:hypothetical protein